MRVLLISNGHGEDRIGLSLAREWLRQVPELQFQALALVGTGLAYQQAQIPLLHAGFDLPSQGFAYLHPLKLWQDLRAGLPRHLYQSWKQLKQARFDGVLAVGDIVSLWAARQCGIPYAFVACALSDYYLGENSRRTTFDPLQLYWLRQDQARVYARDALTAQNLKLRGVDAKALGNPMLERRASTDNKIKILPPFFYAGNRDLSETNPLPRLIFLPGSHVDAPQNLKDILKYCTPFLQQSPSIIYLPLPGSALKQSCREVLLQMNWRKSLAPEKKQDIWFKQKSLLIILDAEDYFQALAQADIAVGLSGTANEQAVACGLPVLSFDGRGLQYTPDFAEAQQRLLGPGLIYLGHPHAQIISWQLAHMWQHLALYQKRAQECAQQRFGKAGAIERIVKDLRAFLGSRD